jgi:hypothetical protein
VARSFADEPTLHKAGRHAGRRRERGLDLAAALALGLAIGQVPAADAASASHARRADAGAGHPFGGGRFVDDADRRRGTVKLQLTGANAVPATGVTAC